MRKLTWMMSMILVLSMILGACAAPPAQTPVATEKPAATEAPVMTEAPVATEPAQVEGRLPDLGGKSVTVAVENAYPPFNSIDPNTNQGIGWDYDAVTEICKRLNCKPEFKQAAWDGIFPAMQAGEYDMLADGVTITEEREKIVDFSLPYVTVSQVLLVRAAETLDVEAMKADAAQIVGTQIGTTNEIVAKENFGDARVKSFEDFGASILALISGDVDGVVIDTVSASGFMKENEGKMKVAGILTSDEQLGFVFPPGSDLKAAVDAALQAMTADGTLETINKKWGLVAEAAGPVKPPDLGGKAITVAVENAYPPFNSIDPNTNQGIGWDYDAVTEICKRLNCKPEFKQAAWDGIFPAMEAGEYDMLADGVTITEEREKIVDFSLPYVTVSQVLLVRAAETLDVDGMKADASKLVGTQIGTTNEIVAKKNFGDARVKSFEDFGASILALISGDVDGVVIDTVSASGFMKENEGKMKVAGILTSDEQLGFVFPPGSDLKAAVDAALQAMTADGTLKTLNMKWGLIPPETKMEGRLPDLGGKTITVAVENAYPPFNSIDPNTNKGVGWDYDVVTEICKRINCVPEFKQAAWDGIFPAMQAGEYDMLADGVTITEEREKIVDFSMPYVTVSQVLLVRAAETLDVDGMKADTSKLVGTQIGTTNEIVAKENFGDARVKSFEDFGASILALLSGDVDGVVIDTVSAFGFMKENEGKMKVAGILTSDEQLGFVFPPGSDLKAVVDAALYSMMSDGTLEALNKKWGLIP